MDKDQAPVLPVCWMADELAAMASVADNAVNSDAFVRKRKDRGVGFLAARVALIL